MAVESLAAPIVTLAEAQAFARIESGEEEALLAGFVRSASAICEAFLGQAVIARPFAEQLTATSDWQRLTTVPVQSIDGINAAGAPIPPGGYSIDIDSSGNGWVRITDPAFTGRVEVTGVAGIAASQNGVPEPIRHGVLRLVAHMFAARDGDGGELPTAVTALWRPYRRMRLA